VNAKDEGPHGDEAVMAASAASRLLAAAASFNRFTGRSLTPGQPSTAPALWRSALAVVAHGLEADPVFFYGNRLALDLFEIPAAAFIRMPSRLSAEPLLRDERARLMARVSAEGFIDDYAGVRVSAAGRRFRIEQAVV